VVGVGLLLVLVLGQPREEVGCEAETGVAVSEKTLWVVWNTGEVHLRSSPLRQRVLDMWEASQPGWEVRVVGVDNAASYLPSHMLLQGMSYWGGRAAPLADALRVALLAKYGGVYVDVTAIPTRAGFLDEMWAWLQEQDLEYIGVKDWFPTVPCKWELGVWFMMAKRDSAFLMDWNQRAVTSTGLASQTSVELLRHPDNNPNPILRRPDLFDCPETENMRGRAPGWLEYHALGWVAQANAYATYDLEKLHYMRARCTWDKRADPERWRDELGQPIALDPKGWLGHPRFQQRLGGMCYVDSPRFGQPIIKVTGGGGYFKKKELTKLLCDRMPDALLNPRCGVFLSAGE